MTFIGRHGGACHENDHDWFKEFLRELEPPHTQATTLTVPSDRITTALEHYTPKKIIRNGPATIVFWNNGKKTVVKRAEGEEDNTYSAFCAALAIKIFGSNSKLKKIVKTFTEERNERPGKNCI